MVELQEIFNLKYGNSLDLNKLEQVKKGINFVSRTSKNNGVSAVVNSIENEITMPKNSISVSLGGSVLEAFVQPYEYYTGYHIFCLTEKEGIKLTIKEKLFYCVCIRANKYKYSYGRQANRTLKSLLVPSITDIPKWVNQINLNKFEGMNNSISKKSKELPIVKNLVNLSNLFSIENGVASTGLTEHTSRDKELIMYIRPAKTHLRTLRSFISKKLVNPKHVYPAGTLFVSTNGEGSHTYSYVSTEEFVPNSDVSVLIPKDIMSIEEKLYYAKCITSNRYLFSYGRKPKGDKLKNIKIPLLNEEEKRNVKDFIQSLSYSASIE